MSGLGSGAAEEGAPCLDRAAVGRHESVERCCEPVLSMTLKYINACVVTAVGLWLSACAAAMPGYVPEGSKKSALERAKPFDGGDVAASGAYLPSDAEKALDCRRLRGSMIIMIAKLKDTAKGPTPSAASSTAQSAVVAVRGKAIMMEPTAEAWRERARLEAYNGLLADKKCPVMDINAELVSAPKKP
jgi:hypothetical protein